MRSDRRRLIKAGFLVLSLGAAQIARGANMLAVRIWPAADYSRVTLESDAPIQSTQTFIASPPRLAVDIQGMQLNAALRELVGKVQASDPNIAGIRVGQFSANVVRLVIDLNRPPGSPTSIPERSEATDIPGNIGLTEAGRTAFRSGRLPVRAEASASSPIQGRVGA